MFYAVFLRHTNNLRDRTIYYSLYYKYILFHFLNGYSLYYKYILFLKRLRLFMVFRLFFVFSHCLVSSFSTNDSRLYYGMFQLSFMQFLYNFFLQISNFIYHIFIMKRNQKISFIQTQLTVYFDYSKSRIECLTL